MLNRKAVEAFFESYTSSYDASDPKIKLKIDHTYRVASLCDTIATSAGVDPDLAWLSGMLHDIGRFEQVRRYNTFVDSRSVDHAQLSADLLFNEGLLQLLPVTLTKQQAKILELAIRSHSAYRLDPSLSEEELTYCDILRDADKVDIFRVNCDTPKEDIYNVTTEELLNSPVSDGVKKCFENKMAVLRGLRKYPADYIVGHICLYFELVYPLSRRIARQQGYLDQLLHFRSANPDTRSWFAYMRKYIWE